MLVGCELFAVCTVHSQVVELGDIVYVDDGLISLKVTDKTDRTLQTGIVLTLFSL